MSEQPLRAASDGAAVFDRAPGAASGRPRGRARPLLGFTGICLGYFVIILDGSVLNVAVPTIRAGLGSSMAGAQWVLNGYTLTLAALLLTAGALGDRMGLRRMLLGGLAVFALASAACAAAQGTAALLPATLALIPHLFPAAAARSRATVVWVATGAISMAVGPLVGGVLVDTVGWRSIFLINLPLGVAGILLVRAGVAETPRRRTPVDRAGQIAAALTLASLTAGLVQAGSAGWSAPVTLGLLAGSAVAGAWFVWWARRAPHPMLPPSFFAVRIRTSAVASAGLMGFVFYGALFVMSLYFQQLRGWSAAGAGVALLPMTVGSTVGPLLLYRPLSERFGHRLLLPAGFVCCAAGVVTLALAGPDAPYSATAVGLLLIGVASTMAFSALTSLLMANVPQELSGLASGVQNTSRQSGALIAVAVLGALLNGSSPRQGLPAAFAVLVGAVLLGVAVGVCALRAAGTAGREHAGQGGSSE
ncbi:MFS transporter [Streptomyces sp. NHF165]|uniref:MFS transporter n=1 Tax=Streptomyces sp. NHF165 TaxID=2175864 RepID=UPI00135CE4F9|nr:MFS transporter [Streptomyces sp. NHF165]